MNTLTAALWLILSALCLAQAVAKFPPLPKKEHRYLVSYVYKTGEGHVTLGVNAPLSYELVKEMEEKIADMSKGDPNFSKPVVIRNIVKLSN